MSALVSGNEKLEISKSTQQKSLVGWALLVPPSE